MATEKTRKEKEVQCKQAFMMRDVLFDAAVAANSAVEGS